MVSQGRSRAQARPALQPTKETIMNRSPTRIAVTCLALTAIGLGLTGCGTYAAHTPRNSSVSVDAVADPATPALATTAPAPTAQAPIPSTFTPAAPRPTPVTHFTTPEAAMRYLAAAYNRNDVAALKKVTNASARAALTAMRSGAVNLRLESCSRRPTGDYTCDFRHDFPERPLRRGHGHATFLAAPADRPGWYMSILVDCD
jgi:hypothetical protein